MDNNECTVNAGNVGVSLILCDIYKGLLEVISGLANSAEYDKNAVLRDLTDIAINVQEHIAELRIEGGTSYES